MGNVTSAKTSPSAAPRLSDREIGTILAALRARQIEMDVASGRLSLAEANGARVEARELAMDGGIEPLTSDEIDALCERINGGM
jgi:hypothetical protein